MKYIPITVISVLSSSLVMALIVVPIIGTQSYKIRNLFLFFFIPILLFGIINFITYSFLSKFQFDKYLNLGIKALASIAIAFLIYKTFKFIKGRGFLQTISIPKISADEDEDLTDITKVGFFTNIYLFILKISINNPIKITIVAVSLLIGIYAAYGKYGKGVIFFPSVEAENTKVIIYATGNLSVIEKDQLVRNVEQKIIQLQTKNNEFESVYTTSGNVSNRRESSPDIIGFIDIEFMDWDKRRKADVLISEIRDATSTIPGIKVETRTQRAGPPRGKPIEINLTSNDPAITILEVKRIQEYLSDIQGLKDLETSLPSPSIEYQLYVNREEAAKYGASIAIIGNTIKLITGGLKLSEFRPDDSDESIPIYLRLPENQRTIDQLNSIKIPTSSGYVPISNFTEIETTQETGNLVRVDQNRIETIKSDVVRFYQTDAYVRLIKHWLGIQKFDIPNNFGLDLPEFNSADIDPRVKVSFKGEDESQKQSQDFLQKAFMIAIFLMGVILLTQFNSFSSAILILFAVIMSTVGVVLGLLITQQPFGIVMSGIGVISLAGIVVNNNIVLIDTFDRLYKKTKNAKEALLMTGAQRLRPVLLTTTTTVLGLMPMALKINIDFVNLEYTYNSPDTQWWVDLSRAIIFGLLFSTLLTLLVTPAALMIKSRFLSGDSTEKSKKVKKQIKYS
jgi:multidrug efflux pump